MPRKTITVKYGEKVFPLPNASRMVKHIGNDFIMVFPNTFKDNAEIIRRKGSLFFGVGQVRAIKKGENFDLLQIDFGSGFARDVIVQNSRARRQIYTTKRGQFTSVYGFIMGFTEMENNKRQMRLYAFALQGWYVPKNFDIEHYEDPEKIDAVSKEEIDLENFIDQFKGEDL